MDGIIIDILSSMNHSIHAGRSLPSKGRHIQDVL